MLIGLGHGVLAQDAPIIVTPPASQAVLHGETATFDVAVSGAGPFTFQWRHDGAELPGIVITAAGNGVDGYSGDGSPATNASLTAPVGVAVDGLGNLYVADSLNNRVRKVATNGVVTTVAGDGTNRFFGDGGAATNASLNSPWGLAVDVFGNLFIADLGNGRVRKVSVDGIITTIAGGGTNDPGNNGPAVAARLAPRYLTLDRFGNLFIAETENNRIREVGTNGLITVLAGNGTNGFSGDDGPAGNASLNAPRGIAIDQMGNLFIADSGNNRVREVGTNGLIQTVVGGGYNRDGNPALGASLNDPWDVTLDGVGDLFIADFFNNRVRKVGTNGIITTVLGNGLQGYSGDGGWATNAELNGPAALATSASGSLFVADANNYRVRQLLGPTLWLNNVTADQAGNYDVVVMSPSGSVTSSVAVLTVLLPPAVTQQPISEPAGVGGAVGFSVSATGTEPFHYQWYLNGLALAGQTNSVLGLTNVGFADAGGYQVELTNLYGSATSSVATLTVGLPPSISTQPTNQTAVAGGAAALSIEVSGAGPFTYQWQLNGTNLPNLITTVAGNGTNGFSGDGGPATNAELNYPASVAVDGAGNLFIADFYNNRVRKVAANGVISTVAGNGTNGFSGDDGPATNAELNYPASVALDGAGNLFFADYGNGRIREVGTNGIITTVAGNGTNGFFGDGGPATNAALNYPLGVVVDGSGNLFIADSQNNLVRKVETNGVITTVAGNGAPGYWGDGGLAQHASLQIPTGVAVDGAGNLYIADNYNQRIREVGTNGIIMTVAGNGAYNFSHGCPECGPGTFSGDGWAATNAGLNAPSGVATDGSGNLLIADLLNDRIRQVTPDGIITTLVGDGPRHPDASYPSAGFAGFGYYSGDGDSAANAALNAPSNLAVDTLGDLFIADFGNQRIREVTTHNAPSLELNNLGASQSGSYDVIITSPFGSVTSSVVSITVASPSSLRLTRTGTNSLRLDLTSAPGQTNILEEATGLESPLNWQPVFTNVGDAEGHGAFTNADLSAHQALFYRLANP
ncbi:MAG TPA: hypothetical protein VHB20_12130 [Verrucomicrobiae bacterium]|nr:hypothetical protein [Verrucomicrobiae bacterium]